MSTFSRMAKYRGEDFTYTVFTEGSRDAYEDVPYTADPTPDTIRGIRNDGGQRTVLMQTGEERNVDVSVVVANPILNSAGVAVTIEDDMTNRAPTLTDSDGRIYKVAGVGHEGVSPTGTQRLLCVREAG
jgi:hypothetical protein